MRQHHGRNGWIYCPVILLAVALPAAPAAWAQRAEPVPDGLEGVGITEHPDAQLPLDLEFVGQGGRTVPLREFFDGKLPVILTLNYYTCPMLCGLQLNGLLDALKELALVPGEDFRILTVSIDPTETHTLATLKKQNYIKAYADAGENAPDAAQQRRAASAAAGWSFLVGQEENIRRLAATVGFGYKYVEERKEYAHAAALILCTPDGRVSRYLYGVLYEPGTLRLSLVEAGQGKVGSSLDQILLYCFHYDPSKGRYGPAALNIMRLGGIVTLLVVGAFLLRFWRRDPGRSPAPRNAHGQAGA